MTDEVRDGRNAPTARQDDGAGPALARPRTGARTFASRWRLREAAPLLVLVALCIAVALINPRFLTFGNFARLADAAMVPLALGLGLTFVIIMGSIDLSAEGVVTLTAVCTSLLVLNGATAFDLGLFGVAIAIVFGVCTGAVSGLVHVRLRIPSFMATLGVGYVAGGIANSLLGGVAVRIQDPMIRSLAVERFLGIRKGFWLALACLGVAFVIQTYTRLGRRIYMLGGGEELAAMSGIDPRRVRLATFALAAFFYAVGGVLAAAQLGLGNAQIGDGRLFTAITAVVVGGTPLTGGHGGVLHTLVGVFIVVVLSNGMVLMGIPPNVQEAVQGLLIIVAVGLSIDRKRLRIIK